MDDNDESENYMIKFVENSKKLKIPENCSYDELQDELTIEIFIISE